MPNVKAWKVGAAGEPDFPDDFEIVKKAVLQKTDVNANNNKYYAIELHKAANVYRVFTHYGRTDDLETNPEAGAKETRYFDSPGEAQAGYEQIFRQKTGASKGYKEVALASSKIGSHRARGQSVGEVDARTLQKIVSDAPKAQPSSLPAPLQDLVRYIYAEATNALTTTVAAKITAHGIETPLGVLTMGQIEKGEAILEDLYGEFTSGKKRSSALTQLSSDFYTAIPHRIGRARTAIEAAVIDSLPAFEEKQETLQLMRDMLKVNGDGSVLFEDEVDKKLKALQCEVVALDATSAPYREISELVLKSQIKTKTIKVRNVFTLKRPDEWGAYRQELSNQRHLFHGSRIKNWVGILSRGILMPKIVVSMGVSRTDAGWLGNGIYFGDASCTSAFYTTPGKKGTRFMAVARVALGKMKDYTKITYGLPGPPAGYDSCHGVRHVPGAPSEFADDEYVVYDNRQQRLEYLVEFAA